MKKLFPLVVIFFVVILVGCGNKKSNSEYESVKPTIPKITRLMAQEKLLELSDGLDIYHDDIKEFTLCRCHYNTDEMIFIIPYVVLSDDDYSVSLLYHVLYSGNEPLHFDTLYIKTNEGVKKFKHDNVTILYGYNVVEEFNGVMNKEVYDTLKKAVSECYAKIRIEGRQIVERNLTVKELKDFEKVFAIYEYFSNVEVE